jgi:CheY-like chemotaxis protein
MMGGSITGKQSDRLAVAKCIDYGFVSDAPRQPVILLVEDNPADVTLICEALLEHDVKARIFLAKDGQQALVLVQTIDAGELRCPDLVVLDVNLPKVSGFKVLERLRASPKCGSKPVLIFTSSNAEADRREAERLGASRYTPKPSDLDSFMTIGRELKEMLAK